MDEKIKEEWIKRLRSGNYEQGIGFLNKDDKYCCLGVLCEIAVEEGILEKIKYDNAFSYDGYMGNLPVKVDKWCRFSQNKKFYVGDDSYEIIDLNDTKKLSFLEIADVLEKQA
jgi:hypothetical protein